MDLTWLRKATPTVPVGPDELAWFNEQIGTINMLAAETIDTRRKQSDDARFCKWDGQSTDARKWRELLGKEPNPFNGCSDQRVPLVDMLVNEDVALCFLAGLRMLVAPGVRMAEATDAAKAAYLEQALRWMLQTQMGLEAVREMLLLLNYIHGDVPGTAVLEQQWLRKTQVLLETLRLDDVARRMDDLTKGAVHPDTGETAGMFLVRAVQTPGLQAEAEQILAVVLEPLGVQGSELKAMVRELATDGRTEFPQEVVSEDRVQWRALRAFEDVWWDSSRRNDDEVDMWFVPRWMTRREARQAARDEGWSEGFLRKLCGAGNDANDKGNPGMSMFVSARDTTTSNVFQAGYAIRAAKEHSTDYEVVDVYFRATDSRGRTGWYRATVAATVDEAAGPARLQAYKHGRSPFQVLQREYLRANMIDTRGVPACFEPFQWALKLEIDMHNDVTQMGTLPPVIGPESRLGKFRLQPGGYIPELKPGEFRFMPTPPGSTRNDEAHQALLWRMVNEFAGRPGENVPPETVVLLRQFKVAVWLAQLSVALTRTLQLTCQYLSPEKAQRLLNVAEDPLPRTAAEIMGSYDCALWLDARDLTDSEHLQKIAKIMVEAITQLDRDGTINTTPWAQALAQRLDPRLAAVSMTGQQASMEREMEEEKAAFASIAAGVEPRLLEGPNYNYMARLDALRKLEQTNAEDIQSNWTDVKRELLARRKQNLGMGLQQQENAQTGRTGVEAEA